MSPEITIPLGIADVKVLEQEITENNELIIYVESTQETTPCGVCGDPIKCTYGKGQEIRLRHLSVFNMKTYICIRPKRGQCLSCLHDPTTTQIVSWYTQRSPHTNAFDKHILRQLINSTIEDVSLKEEVGYDAVLGVLKAGGAYVPLDLAQPKERLARMLAECRPAVVLDAEGMAREEAAAAELGVN